MKIAGAIVLTLAAALPVAAIDIKGIAPGMTKEQVDKRHPSLRCAATAGHEESKCEFITTSTYASTELDNLAEIRVRNWQLTFRDNALESLALNFYEDVSSALSAALAVKFGKPKVTTHSTQNAMGATYKNRFLTWTDGKDVLTLVDLGGPAPSPTTLVLASIAAERRAQERQKSDAVRKAKDL